MWSEVIDSVGPPVAKFDPILMVTNNLPKSRKLLHSASLITTVSE